jgi:hypothetical protein
VHRCVDVRENANKALLRVCPEASFGVWTASIPADAVAVDTRTHADGIGAPRTTGRDWDWAFGKAELQKGYVAAAGGGGVGGRRGHGGGG